MPLPMSQLLVILMFGYVVEPLLTKVYIENAIRCREGGEGKWGRGEEGGEGGMALGAWGRVRT